MSAATDNRLLTPADLAELFGVSERKVMEWRRSHGWPFVRVGRTYRFTPGQVEAIVAKHSQTQPATQAPTRIPGQTARSAARRRS